MNDYQKTLRAAEAELSELMVEKSRIDIRVNNLRETIIAITRLLSSDDEQSESLPHDAVQIAEAGLTESIRDVLKEFRSSNPNQYHLPTKIRDRLSVKGFSLTQYKNEMAAIHNVLKRLKDLGEVDIGMDTDGKTYYRWVAPVQNVVVPEAARLNLETFAPTVRKGSKLSDLKATLTRKEMIELQQRALEGNRNREKAQAAMAKAKKFTVPTEEEVREQSERKRQLERLTKVPEEPTIALKPRK